MEKFYIRSAGSSKDDSSAAGNAKNGKVYYLNFKPEQDKDWQMCIRDRIVTTVGQISTFFISSRYVLIVFAAEGAQEPFSTIATFLFL